jgi:hypothetical protein
MANTEVTFTHDGSFYLPAPSSVPVIEGDTVVFATDDGSPAVLFFSPGAASILSPAPGANYAIPPHGKVEFSFKSSAAGAYSVYAGADASCAPSSYPSEVAATLLVEIDPNSPGYNGPHGGMRAGS